MKQHKSADADLFKRAIADFERHIIVAALEQTGGNQNKAAMRLGTTKRILAYRVRKYGIDIGPFLQNRRRKQGTKGVSSRFADMNTQ
jgi:transcriptional regulator with GAF, ATPase, and Fis domain